MTTTVPALNIAASQLEAERMRERDLFNAFVAVRPDAVVSTTGSLAGVDVAVKDNIKVAGLPFSAGQPIFHERIADCDAAIVKHLRAAGARILGVTRTDAGGFGVTTPEVINPLASDRIVGGSSGGAAAAVAAGLADLGLGTDTGGSVRIPAACCELFAFKPTYGGMSLEGVWPLSPSLDHLGLLAKKLVVLQRAAAVLAGFSWPAIVPESLRLGVDFERVAACDAAVSKPFLQAIERLVSTGISVSSIQLPDRATVARTHGVLVLSEARRVYAEYWPGQAAQLADAARRALNVSDQLERNAEAQARATAADIEATFARLWGSVDAILTPTLPIAPPLVNTHRVMLGSASLPITTALVLETCLANLTGSPAVVIPVNATTDAPQTSIQIVSARGSDLLALKLAEQLDAVLNRADRGRT